MPVRRGCRAILAVSLCTAFVHLGVLARGEEIPRLTFAQLVDSIRANLEVTLTIKSYSGKEVEMDKALKSELTIFPPNLAWDADMPVKPGPDGMYPRAIPGKTVVI